MIDKLMQAMEHSLIDFLRKGEWIKLDYSQRLQVDAAWLRSMWAKIDLTRVMALVAAKCEEKVADSILNSMATEVANDVKSIMCNKELREDIRALIREKIRAIEGAV